MHRNPLICLLGSMLLAAIVLLARPVPALGQDASPATQPAKAAMPVEVGKETCLIQGFESEGVFAKQEHVSWLSGVPEDSDVEVWDNKLYQRRRPATDEVGIACSLSEQVKTQGSKSLQAKFARPDQSLRISLKNNIGQPDDKPRDPCNGLGMFDCLRGDIFNPADKPVPVELRVLGGFAVTDRNRALAIEKTLELKPGWNDFTVTATEASKMFCDSLDATSLEFVVPQPADTVLYFDNFRMEAQSIGKNMAAIAKCFDFGCGHFTWPGFTYGSVAYDEAKGYGFTGGKSLTHGGDMHIFNDALTRDGLNAPATFKCKLPNGKYRCVTRTGNYWGQRDGDLNIQIKAGPKQVYYRPRLSREQYNRLKYTLEEKADQWKRDFDLWGTYEDGSNFREVRFEAEVSDGALELEFCLPNPEGLKSGGASVWNYLIVYPIDKAGLVEPEIDWLNEKIRSIYNNVMHTQFGRLFGLYNREEVICAEEFLWPELAAARKAALKPTAEEKQRGYLHFLRNAHDLVTPDSVPLPNETGDRIAVFGAPGQTVLLSVALYGLKDLKAVQVGMGELTSADGKTTIAAKEAKVELVSYRPMTPVTSNHSECFNYIGPGVLLPGRAVDMPAEYPRQFWISLALPETIPAGIYQGAAQVSVEGKPTSSVQVSLRVLPVKLEQPAGVTFAVAFSQFKSFWDSGEVYELDFFRRIGLNTIWYGGDRQEEMEQLARAAQLSVEKITDKYANWRWPEEYSAGVIKRFVDSARPISFQPVHTGYREGRRVRFSHGFWLWRSGIRHRVIQTQPNAAERVFYAHAGHNKFGPCNYLFPCIEQEGVLLPGPSWYDVREGITDWRYIQTLEGLAKSGPDGAGGSPATPSAKLAQAKAYLAELRESLEVGLDNYYCKRRRDFNHVDRFGLKDTVWPGRRYDMERWEIANLLCAAKRAPLEAKADARPAAAEAPKDQAVILHAERFGPFYVDESQWKYVNSQAQGQPSLLAETPKTPAGENWATVLVTINCPSPLKWVAVLKNDQGKELARQEVGVLERFKTRWVLRTAHLPPGTYSLQIEPADGQPKDEQAKECKAQIRVLPGL